MVNINNLFNRIAEMGLTAKKVSDDTGISTGNLSDWKKGRCFPSAEKLDILASYLDCSVDYLIGRSSTPRTEGDEKEKRNFVMFYDRFTELCEKAGLKPSKAAELIGFNRSNVSTWKKMGYTPRRDALIKIADYFNVTVDYLLDEDVSDSVKDLSEKEKRVISAYRDNPDIQPAVDRLLKIEEPVLRMVPQEDPAQEPAKIVAFGGANDTVEPNGSYQERLALQRKIDENENNQ